MFRPIFVVIFAVSVLADYRILNGKHGTIQDYPYVAALRFGSLLVGGGAIISPRHILTAAHPKAGIKNLDYFKVQVGSQHYDKDGFTHTIQSFDTYVDSSVDGLLSGDLAVITLHKPINFTADVQPIAIVPEGQEPSHGEMLTVTGWGATQVNSESTQLQIARLAYIEKEICNEAWRVGTNGEIQLGNYTLCAGGGATAIFNGDSGNPVVNDRKQLVGIVSWGRKRKPVLGYPCLFVNLANPEMQRFISSSSHGANGLAKIKIVEK